ncbi:hypothetical protein N7489_011420 [Penicillium chrysogenum]|uniref:Uncharacterized protein n=1 Tax=Penicillium chrysogenum TaxID=5076 RepID=A0ABQ8W1I2_PENCH|nr:uncharacterized protein N7489_011420 [Penicillium chrysogenum]KAJ5230712.1 hypothetical protein N7489_011420 [Penicillium chrysogenum]KAJ5254587.1 hypothetical protein N7505_011796 [Penicillium chrysogenum]KAJ5268187.1 hypothetical protein N7524_005646 [Penicillium chrysogenum]KAJ6163054.1 hypothetical protein N7497_003033 [Penicillium chrysogenum]
MRSSPLYDDFDPFTNDEEAGFLLERAINYVRDILGLLIITPAFIGYGSKDLKISIEIGRNMSYVLSAGSRMDVT